MKIPRVRALLACWIGSAICTHAAGNPPSWWTQRAALTAGATANDYAAANIGQVKRIAALAADEMQAKLPGGAGTRITALVASWSQPPGPGVARQDYAAINLGQLKALAQLFYDRLAEVNYAGAPLSAGQRYPWTTATSDDADYAIANLGQVKFVFSFDPSLVDTTPPSILSLTATPAVIAPPNKKSVPVSLTASVTDAGDPAPTTRIISVSMSDTPKTTGKGKPSTDYVVTGPMTLDVLADTTGSTDRIYSIVVESRDRSNNAATRTVTVTVQHGK